MTTKERIAKYLEYKQISQYEFSKRTGLANGFLNSGANVTSIKLDIITTEFSDLNLIWLVKGIGPMIIPTETNPVIYSTSEGDSANVILREDYKTFVDQNLENMPREHLVELNKMLKKIVQAKSETVQAKEEIIATLQQLINEKDSANVIKDQLIAHLQKEKNRGCL